MNMTEKTGALIAIKDVTDNDDLMIINRSGIIIRLGIAELRIMGRATQGVRLIKINEGDSIAAVAKVEVEAEVEVELNIEAEPTGDENGTMTNNEETILPSGDNSGPEN